MSEGLSPRVWVLNLPYVKPPLSANYRQHHMKRYRLEQEVQEAVGWLARQAKIPALGRCRVQLHYRPERPGRRDTDNLVATLKPCCDGLVHVGVVSDDTPNLMAKPEPIIHPARARVGFGPHDPILWVEVTVISERPVFDAGGSLPPAVSVVTNSTGRSVHIHQAGGGL